MRNYNLIKKQRNVFFDIVRILCTFEIVGFWHLFNYADSSNSIWMFELFYNKVGSTLTMISMSIFMFMSGYFLRKYDILAMSDFLFFFKKRFSRFYVLFVLSVLTLYLGSCFSDKQWFSGGLTQLVLTLLGFNTFFPPQPGTIWFISMLLLFYILTPFVLYVKTYRNRWLLVFMFYSIMLYFNYNCNEIDSRFWELFPMYIIGLLWQNSWKKRFVMSLSLFLLLGGIISSYYLIVPCANLIISFSICGLLVCTSSMNISCCLPYYFQRIILNCSSATMCLYLFHRQFFQVFLIISNKIGFPLTYSFLLFFWLPIAWYASYIMQKCYDILERKYFRVSSLDYDINK